MKMHNVFSFLMGLLLLLAMPVTSVRAGSGNLPDFKTLQPGSFLQINHPLKVNVVFLGYDNPSGPRSVDLNAFKSGLPTEYRTINRNASFYVGNQFMGLNYTYDYNILKANPAFENAFFAYLKSIAVAKPLTLYQKAYNAQIHRTLDVTSNAWIDAPSVEKWLAGHADAALGIDTTQYTVFLINWYSRPDFMFHVYSKTGEPDPSTGVDFGLLDSRKIDAWGGTPPDDPQTGLGSLHRIWFYDISAGPVYYDSSCYIDNADLDGDGVLDYRMPPVWEYGNLSGYRPFNDLSGDLSKIVRYVAIDLLFTPSPLYKPTISPPKLPENIELDINLFEELPGYDATQDINKTLILKNLSQLQPNKTFTIQVKDAPLDNRIYAVLNCFSTWLSTNTSCYGNRLHGFAIGDLFLYFNDHLMQYLEGDADYEMPVFAFATEDFNNALVNFADDNWRDGTQSYVFAEDTPDNRQAGFGLTAGLIHEIGHHLGLPHPHDGFDYESNKQFSISGQYYYAWTGDESNTVMSYIELNWEFSQFDRDSMNRWLVSGYLNQANVILQMIAASPQAGQVSSLLSAADGNATLALSELQKMNYLSAESLAKTTYWQVMTAAAQVNINVEPQSWQADYKARGVSSQFVDSVYNYRLAP